MTEDRAYLKKEEVNFDSENYVDFLRKMQELYQYQPSYATHAFTDIKSFSGKKCPAEYIYKFTRRFSERNVWRNRYGNKTDPVEINGWKKFLSGELVRTFSMSSGCKDKSACMGIYQILHWSETIWVRRCKQWFLLQKFLYLWQYAEQRKHTAACCVSIGKWWRHSRKMGSIQWKSFCKSFSGLQLDSILTEIRNECMEQKITPEECAKLFQQRAELYVNE